VSLLPDAQAALARFGTKLLIRLSTLSLSTTQVRLGEKDNTSSGKINVQYRLVAKRLF
jgi:hypothetical protein